MWSIELTRVFTGSSTAYTATRTTTNGTCRAGLRFRTTRAADMVHTPR
jgi:hypothetical protein